MFCFGVLRIFGRNRRSAKRRKTGQKIGPFRHSEGLPRHSEGLPRRSEAEGPKRPPLGCYAAAKRYPVE